MVPSIETEPETMLGSVISQLYNHTSVEAKSFFSLYLPDLMRYEEQRIFNNFYSGGGVDRTMLRQFEKHCLGICDAGHLGKCLQMLLLQQQRSLWSLHKSA